MSQDHSPYLNRNSIFSNVNYEVNTAQSANIHNRYILLASVPFMMIADKHSEWNLIETHLG